MILQNIDPELLGYKVIDARTTCCLKKLNPEHKETL